MSGSANNFISAGNIMSRSIVNTVRAGYHLGAGGGEKDKCGLEG